MPKKAQANKYKLNTLINIKYQAKYFLFFASSLCWRFRDCFWVTTDKRRGFEYGRGRTLPPSLPRTLQSIRSFRFPLRLSLSQTLRRLPTSAPYRPSVLISAAQLSSAACASARVCTYLRCSGERNPKKIKFIRS